MLFYFYHGIARYETQASMFAAKLLVSDILDILNGITYDGLPDETIEAVDRPKLVGYKMALPS